MERLLLALALLLPADASAKGVEVRFPGPGIELVGRLYVPDGEGRRPAVVMLHGCSGLWGRAGEPTRSYDAWAENLRIHGFVALLVDSFGPRGEREICSQKDRRVSPSKDRPRDAFAALGWLAARADVDPGSIHLLGWSNGGIAVLNTLRADAPGRPSAGAQFRSAVAFYPGCSTLARARYVPSIPLLIQAGGADDWTPSKPCEALAAAAKRNGADVQIDVYEGAYHAFDRVDGAVRRRPEVRNPTSPTGLGATVGPNPAAREKSWKRATDFFEAHR